MNLLNLVTFYLGWFACVWGAANQRPLLGLGVTLLILVVHCVLMPNPSREIRLILITGLIGFCIDTLLAICGILTFQGAGLTSWLSPPWMVALWMLFATTLHTSLSWLAGRYLIAVLLGVIGGPASYYAGAQLGALTLHLHLAYSLGVIAIAWGGVMPILLKVAYNEK
jgi:Protein of unknown function (DUF2878)